MELILNIVFLSSLFGLNSPMFKECLDRWSLWLKNIDLPLERRKLQRCRDQIFLLNFELLLLSLARLLISFQIVNQSLLCSHSLLKLLDLDSGLVFFAFDVLQLCGAFSLFLYSFLFLHLFELPFLLFCKSFLLFLELGFPLFQEFLLL